MSKSAKAGLTFPVARFQRNLRKGHYADRIGTAGAVYLAGVLEYLSAEVLELAGNAAKENKKQRIIPRHILLAIKNDAELDQLFGDAMISCGGVMPNIHPTLLPKQTKRKDSTNDVTSSENF